MAEQNPMFYNINGVVVMYPRMNKTYRFDNTERKSVPCGVFEDGAAYTTSFLMTKAQAKELYEAMAQAYTMKREPSWPEKFEMPFKKNVRTELTRARHASRVRMVKMLHANQRSMTPRGLS